MKVTKIFILHSIFIFSLTAICIASDYSYDVTGESESGYVTGEVEANKDSKGVEGYLTDENGNQVYFEGEWTGKGEIEGTDENGNHVSDFPHPFLPCFHDLL